MIQGLQLYSSQSPENTLRLAVQDRISEQGVARSHSLMCISETKQNAKQMQSSLTFAQRLTTSSWSLTIALSFKLRNREFGGSLGLLCNEIAARDSYEVASKALPFPEVNDFRFDKMTNRNTAVSLPRGSRRTYVAESSRPIEACDVEPTRRVQGLTRE